MVSFVNLAISLAAASGLANALPTEVMQALERKQAASYPITNYKNDYATVNYTSGPAGQISIDWNNGFGGDFVIGKGYSPARDIVVNYTGTFEPDRGANAYLALYGWMTNPLVEYYVIEAMGVHNPSDNASATQYGELESDGGTYEIWQKWRKDAPGPEGSNTTITFNQYWSIRTKMHCGGSITAENHFRAWEAAGLPVGDLTSFYIAVEGQQGGGTADLTVGVSPTTFPQETPTSTRRTQTYHYSTHITGHITNWFPPTTTTTKHTSTTSTTVKPTTSTTAKPPTSTSTITKITTSTTAKPTTTVGTSSDTSTSDFVTTRTVTLPPPPPL